LADNISFPSFFYPQNIRQECWSYTARFLGSDQKRAATFSERKGPEASSPFFSHNRRILFFSLGEGDDGGVGCVSFSVAVPRWRLKLEGVCGAGSLFRPVSFGLELRKLGLFFFPSRSAVRCCSSTNGIAVPAIRIDENRAASLLFPPALNEGICPSSQSRSDPRFWSFSPTFFVVGQRLWSTQSNSGPADARNFRGKHDRFGILLSPRSTISMPPFLFSPSFFGSLYPLFRHRLTISDAPFPPGFSGGTPLLSFATFRRRHFGNTDPLISILIC